MRTLGALGLMAVALAGGACGGSGSGAASATSAPPTTAPASTDATTPASTETTPPAVPDKVRFVFDWPSPDFELVPIVVGMQQGLYKDAGLEVSVSFPPDTATTVKVLGSGDGDIGLVTTTDMIAAVKASVPITSIANYSQSNNWGLFTRPGVPIDITSLKGKRISGFGDTWTKAMLPFVLKTAGLTETDVKQVIVDNDAPLLLNGKIDIATNTTNYLPPTIRESTGGKDPGVLLAKDAGAPDVPIWVYAGRQGFLSDNPDAVTRWLAATAKATEWAIANPEEAVTMFETAYPKNGYSHAYNLDGWNQTIPVLKNAAGQLFIQTDAQWTDLANALVGVGALDAAAPAGSYYTNLYAG